MHGVFLRKWVASISFLRLQLVAETLPIVTSKIRNANSASGVARLPEFPQWNWALSFALRDSAEISGLGFKHLIRILMVAWLVRWVAVKVGANVQMGRCNRKLRSKSPPLDGHPLHWLTGGVLDWVFQTGCFAPGFTALFSTIGALCATVFYRLRR